MIGTGSLEIRSIAETDAGNYQCRASNSMDSADIEYLLMVQVPPKFVQMPTDRIAYEKDELEMVCAIRGKPTPIVSYRLHFMPFECLYQFLAIVRSFLLLQVQWLKNGDVINANNDYMQIVNGCVQYTMFLHFNRNKT